LGTTSCLSLIVCAMTLCSRQPASCEAAVPICQTTSATAQTSVTWYKSPRIFQQPRSNLRILGARRATKSNIHAVNPNTLGTSTQNLSHPSNLAPLS
jgi:hypothetical protein